MTRFYGKRMIVAVAAVFLAVPVQRDQFSQRCQAALEFPAQLAVLAEKQDFHTLAYWVWTQSR